MRAGNSSSSAISCVTRPNLRLVGSAPVPNVMRVDRTLPESRPGEAREHADGGRLAGAVGPQQPENLAGLGGEGYVRNGGDRAEFLLQTVGDQIHRTNTASRARRALGACVTA